MSESESDRACMARLCAGDARALEELYDRHAPLLYGLVVRIVGRSQDAEEVLQDTWLQVWRSATTWDASRGTVGAWLVTLARSRAIDRFRSRASRTRAEGSAPPPDPPPADDPAVDVAARRRHERVTAALATLGPQQRSALELAYFGGLSQSEIATRVGAPLGTVKSWTRQGLMRLRELMGEERS